MLSVMCAASIAIVRLYTVMCSRSDTPVNVIYFMYMS